MLLIVEGETLKDALEGAPYGRFMFWTKGDFYTVYSISLVARRWDRMYEIEYSRPSKVWVASMQKPSTQGRRTVARDQSLGTVVNRVEELLNKVNE